MERVWITIILALLFCENILGQSGLCDPGVPFYSVDLSGQPGGSYISPLDSRNKHCCGAGNPDRCIEFEITLDPNAVGINFEIFTGAQPPGALFYQVNCGTPVPVGQQICLAGTGPHTLTFCKPGNNVNQYRITSIEGYTNGFDVTTVEDCYTDIQVSGLVDSSVVWNDLTGGGYYESFLSCTSGCSNVIFTTQQGFPLFAVTEPAGDRAALPVHRQPGTHEHQPLSL